MSANRLCYSQNACSNARSCPERTAEHPEWPLYRCTVGTLRASEVHDSKRLAAPLTSLCMIWSNQASCNVSRYTTSVKSRK